MSYKVGQVLYVILKKEATVMPLQVIEEITKKTLAEGEVTSYVVRVGSDPSKVLSISEIDGEIFDSSDKALKTLIDRVSKSITLRVEQAISKAKEWYPTGFEHASDDPLSIIKKTTEQTPVLVNPKQPKRAKGEPPPLPKNAVRPETAALAAEMAAEADAVVMEVPDGNGGMMQAKVRGVKLPPDFS